MTAIAILCLAISSCVVKSQIKTLLNKHLSASADVQKPLKPSTKQLAAFNSLACTYDQPSDVLQKHQSVAEQDGLNSFVLFAVNYFWAAFFPNQAQHTYCITGSPNKLSGSIPIFLRQRKLII